jgi:ABC-type transporter Mla subunit MlaD
MNDQLIASIHELTTFIKTLNETLDDFLAASSLERLNTITYSIDGVSETLDKGLPDSSDLSQPLAEALKQIRDEVSLVHGKNLY